MYACQFAVMKDIAEDVDGEVLKPKSMLESTRSLSFILSSWILLTTACISDFWFYMGMVD